MEQGNTTSLELKNDYSNRIVLRRETAIRMLGVFLFYVVLYVAASEFMH